MISWLFALSTSISETFSINIIIIIIIIINSEA